MDKTEEKALNEKLLKFAGFVETTNQVKRGQGLEDYVAWQYNNTEIVPNNPPDLAKSLDAQHKYIWPKLRELGFMVRYQYSELREPDTGKILYDWTYYASIYDIGYKRGIRHFEHWAINPDSPALACALAVSQLIDAI